MFFAQEWNSADSVCRRVRIGLRWFDISRFRGQKSMKMPSVIVRFFRHTRSWLPYMRSLATLRLHKTDPQRKDTALF